MRRKPGRVAQGGLTLIELMVVVAVMSLLVLLVAPSFQDMVLMNRLRGINAQLITDLQFARAEAVARGKHVRVSLGSDTAQTCYVLYVAVGNNMRCDCTLGAGSACTVTGSAEIRTVSTIRDQRVVLVWPSGQDNAFAFDYVTGGLLSVPTDSPSVALNEIQIDARIDDDRRLRNKVNRAGRPTVCAPNAARMQVAAC